MESSTDKCSMCGREFGATECLPVFNEDDPKGKGLVCDECSRMPAPDAKENTAVIPILQVYARKITSAIEYAGGEFAHPLSETWDVDDVLEEEEHRVRIRRKRYTARRHGPKFTEHIHNLTRGVGVPTEESARQTLITEWLNANVQEAPRSSDSPPEVVLNVD